MDWGVGPPDLYYNGITNQTMFIQGFKIAVREGIPSTKRVNVMSVRLYRTEFLADRSFRAYGVPCNQFLPLEWHQTRTTGSNKVTDAGVKFMERC